jgi:uncharacterized protein (DUF433 family)
MYSFQLSVAMHHIMADLAVRLDRDSALLHAKTVVPDFLSAFGILCRYEPTTRSHHDRPSICHGKPCIRGLRYPVEMLLELLSSGMASDEILADYEDLERDDLLAALAFAARLAQTRRLMRVGP